MKKSDIVLSAASVASALSALGHLGSQGTAIEIASPGGQFYGSAGAAIAGSQAQRYIRAQMPSIAKTLKLDGELLSERYIQSAQWGQTLRPAGNRERVSPLAADSTLDTFRGGDTDTFGCYNNCHSACHGSRGWR
jgi:hypothetical protein